MTLWLAILGWIVLPTQAVLSAILVRKFARRFDRPPRASHRSYQPPVALIVPFKGVDPTFHDNLRGLLEQDYPDYRLLLVVESEEDPAYEAIRDQIAQRPYYQNQAQLLTAGIAPDDTGQKVHNLLAAVDRLNRDRGGEEVWAFADSDAVPGPSWLKHLVGPLAHDTTAVTTGYRWLIPEPDERGGVSLASHLASVMNSSVACWAGRDEYNHAWGGAMAMRVDTARQGDLVGRWRGALSDDYQVTRMAFDLGKRVYFVHQCLTPSPCVFTWRGLFEFGRRQYLITRVHEPGLFFAALSIQWLYVASLAWCWAGLGLTLSMNRGDRYWIIPACALVITFLANQARSTYRRQTVRKAFGQAMVERMAGTLELDRWATPIWMGLHALITLSALPGRTIRWRGYRYRLRGPQSIEKA